MKKLSNQLILALVAVLGLISSLQAQTSENKNYLFIHEAWAFEKAPKIMENQGHNAVTIHLLGHSLASTLLAEMTITACVDKVAAAVDEISSYVVLVAHTLGDSTIMLVGELSSNRFESIIYVIAFMQRNREPLLTLALSDKETQMFLNLSLEPGNHFSFFNQDGVISIFYYNINPKKVQEPVLKLNWQINAFYVQPIATSDEKFRSVKRINFKMLQERMVTPELQLRMINSIPPETVMELDTGHLPFLWKPERFVTTL
ncbi:MAG: hypothetical protein OXC62_13275 [Aestuariivita sp.]|nr:hypothetical protein [Aestuariivita sp.]